MTTETIDANGKIYRTWDWTKFLRDGDSIATATVTGSGVTAGTPVTVGAKVTSLIAPTAEAVGLVSATCHIVTTQGEEQDDTWWWYVGQL